MNKNDEIINDLLKDFKHTPKTRYTYEYWTYTYPEGDYITIYHCTALDGRTTNGELYMYAIYRDASNHKVSRADFGNQDELIRFLRDGELVNYG